MQTYIAYTGAGELLGEAAMMIGEGEVRKASVTAATKCRLSEVTREQLLGTVKRSRPNPSSYPNLIP